MLLGWVGGQPADATAAGIPLLRIGQVCTFWYFFHFVVVLPRLGWFERPRPLPISISQPVLGGGRIAAAAASKPMERA
jgi:ubiquinol-cytochrome c reductase cytochrome b subunit